MDHYLPFDSFLAAVTVGITPVEVRRPRTARIPRNSPYAFRVRTAEDAATVERIATGTNATGAYSKIRTHRQSVTGENTTDLLVVIWGFKPVYPKRA